MVNRRICWGCFEWFTPSNKTIKYCSKSCRDLIAWELQEARLLDTGADEKALCLHRARHPKTRLKRRLNAEDKADIESYKSTMRALREERLKAGKMENVTLRELIKRDGGKCYICGKKVEKQRKFGKARGRGEDRRMYPTIDHLIPISRGGLHTWDNVKLAHLSCNTKKGGKIRR